MRVSLFFPQSMLPRSYAPSQLGWQFCGGFGMWERFALEGVFSLHIVSFWYCNVNQGWFYRNVCGVIAVLKFITWSTCCEVSQIH